MKWEFAQLPGIQIEPISIRLPDDLIDEVRQKAKEHDVPYQQLIRQYIKQGLAGNN